MFFRCSVPKLTVAMVPALLSDSQENNWRIVREGSRALCDETHPADSKFLWPHFERQGEASGNLTRVGTVLTSTHFRSFLECSDFHWLYGFSSHYHTFK